MSSSVDPVNEMIPPTRLAALGLQHVLVMYAGAIAVPLIIAGPGLKPRREAGIVELIDVLPGPARRGVPRRRPAAG